MNENACKEVREVTITKVVESMEQIQQEVYLMLDALGNTLMDSKSPKPPFEDQNGKCLMLRLTDLHSLSQSNMIALRELLGII